MDPTPALVLTEFALFEGEDELPFPRLPFAAAATYDPAAGVVRVAARFTWPPGRPARTIRPTSLRAFGPGGVEIGYAPISDGEWVRIREGDSCEVGTELHSVVADEPVVVRAG